MKRNHTCVTLALLAVAAGGAVVPLLTLPPACPLLLPALPPLAAGGAFAPAAGCSGRAFAVAGAACGALPAAALRCPLLPATAACSRGSRLLAPQPLGIPLASGCLLGGTGAASAGTAALAGRKGGGVCPQPRARLAHLPLPLPLPPCRLLRRLVAARLLLPPAARARRPLVAASLAAPLPLAAASCCSWRRLLGGAPQLGAAACMLELVGGAKPCSAGGRQQQG